MKSIPIRNEYIVFDCAHADSHISFNSALVNQLKELGRIILFAWGSTYTDLQNNTVTVIKKMYLSIGSSNPFLARLIYLINTILNAFYIRSIASNLEKKYIIIGHEIISLGICSFLFPKGVYLIHHMQIDELQNSVKKFFFGLYKKKFIHVVMTEYIKDYLVNHHDVPVDNIRVVCHPLYTRVDHFKKDNSGVNNFIALNYSSDEKFIDSLICYDLKHSAFSKHGCKVTIKSKLSKYSSFGLEIFSGYLSRAEYDIIYDNSDCVLSIVDSSFKYRIGGTIIDAISYGKPVIAIRSAFVEYYQKIFGDGIVVCDNLNSFIEAIVQFKKNKDCLYYSEESISNYNDGYKKMVFKSFS